jgi:hypothetical protein
VVAANSAAPAALRRSLSSVASACARNSGFGIALARRRHSSSSLRSSGNTTSQKRTITTVSAASSRTREPRDASATDRIAEA